jgi:hypothetical protein
MDQILKEIKLFLYVLKILKCLSLNHRLKNILKLIFQCFHSLIFD